MNLLKIFKNFNRRSIQSSPIVQKKLIVREKLNERSLIRVHGDEVIQFLQGLITNDMTNFEKNNINSIYSMFLSNSGRILHDTIIYKTSENNTFFIETDKKGSNDLCRHLRLFRVRRKIDIDNLDNDYEIWVLFQNNIENTKEINDVSDIKINNINSNIISYTDPRTKYLGTRLILHKSITDMNIFKDICSSTNLIESTINNDYKLHRYKLGISEGLDEHYYNKILPFETNLDYLHGISFHKGCYLGQELTARTYHTGVIRKRLMPIKLNKQIDENNKIESVQTSKGILCGKIRGIKNNYCIAVLYIEKANSSDHLIINGDECDLVVPPWWPKELASKIISKNKQS